MNKDFDQVFADVDKVFKQVDQVFLAMDNIIKAKVVSNPEREPWVKWFAWRPVKVNGKHVWFRSVYRRPIPKTYATYDDWTRYEYGSLFDVIKDS